MKYPISSEQDLPQLKRWVDADPAHKNVIEPGFWIRPVSDGGVPEEGIQCLRVEDDKGAVFYLRMENAIRVYVQFPPEEEISKSRLSSALRRAMWFIGGGAKKAGYHEMMFDSKSPSLVAFFERLGFKILENNFRVRL
jgi:hypothetical protein